MNIKNEKAVTLIELMVATLIFSFLVAGIYAAFLAGNRSWSTHENNVALQRDARGALWVMVPDLREAKSVVITQSSGNTAISFTTLTLGSVSYAWSNTGASANQIIRTVGSNTRILARNISAMAFTDLSSAILVDITSTRSDSLGKSANFNLKEKIAYR